MPLTRDTITIASRLMLPTYCAFFALLGINYVTTPRSIVDASPALAFADAIMPLPAWGGLFLTCSVVMLGALIAHRRILFRLALRICALSMMLWAVIIGGASLSGDATPLAFIWPAFPAVACIASDRSLAAREA